MTGLKAHATLHIPLHLTSAKRFFNPNAATAEFLGFAARLSLEQPPYCYLVLDNVPLAESEAILERARRGLTWAAVRLDMGIMTDREPLKQTGDAAFNGQFATAIPRTCLRDQCASKGTTGTKSLRRGCSPP
jgi:hypothetical protein